MNRGEFDAAGVKVISFVGPAGSGKSSLIECVLLQIAPPVRAGLIVGNRAADRQTARFCRHGYPAVSVITENLEAHHVREALPKLNLAALDVLFIEANCNNLSPVEFDLGQHLRIGVFSAAGGDDQVHEFPFLVQESDLVLLTKIDLLPFVSFDLNVFHQNIRRLKPDLSLLPLSVHSGEGIPQLLGWIRSSLTNVEEGRSPQSLGPFLSSSKG